jgi:hypothetical protein
MVLAMYMVTPCTSRSADVKGKNIDAVNSRSQTLATHHTGQRRGLGFCYQGGSEVLWTESQKLMSTVMSNRMCWPTSHNYYIPMNIKKFDIL